MKGNWNHFFFLKKTSLFICLSRLAEDVIEEKVQALRESLLADLDKLEPANARK